VVQEALETTCIPLVYSLWFTPITNIGASPEGAEIITYRRGIRGGHFPGKREREMSRAKEGSLPPGGKEGRACGERRDDWTAGHTFLAPPLR